ncbi:MAG: ribosome recycling factor [Bacteroidia bacterium]|nr:ribosome recycling factor [Bacteroidia bacterium]MDW8157947.1 ribosome recycling factor [Bacteroidia bacterium]
MEGELKKIVEDASVTMAKAVDHFEIELSKIRAGRASAAMLDGIKIEYYGSPTLIAHVANITTSDARTLVIEPYEKNLISAIEKAIRESNLGLTPTNDGIRIRIVLPPLTEERRKQLVKQAKEEAENARIAVRNLRRDYNEQAKKLAKQGYSEDMIKATETEIQKLTDNYIKMIDNYLHKKETEIMTV